DMDMTVGNDGRWLRIFHPGFVHAEHNGRGQRLFHLKDYTQAHSSETMQMYQDRGMYPLTGEWRYRLKAGAGGVSFQVNDEQAQVAPGPWTGGRLQWPGGSYGHLPAKLT